MIKRSVAVLTVLGCLFGYALTAYAEDFSPRFMRTLKQGDKSSDVTQLQEVLAADPAVYPEGKITGYFGQLTAAAVKRFQEKVGIAAVGMVGPLTLEKLNTLSGDSPDRSKGTSQPIKGQYIVVFKDTVGNPADEALKALGDRGGKILHTYSRAIKGFSATLPDAAVEALRNNPNVDYIEQDMTVSLNSIQSNATWGIDRIDQRELPLSTTYTYNSTGAGVNVFVIDTGIRSDHVEFTGRLLPGFDAVGDGFGTSGCHGHGTHVAGTVGGTIYGTAKGVSLIPVRVLNCNATAAWSTVIAGIDWVAGTTLRPALANISIGGPTSTAADAAVEGLISKGITVVVAAGNDNIDACNQSPARVPGVISVGATSILDYRASFSNWGPCLDLFAPGAGIISAWNNSATATIAKSGTSMASPHVAGVAAFILQADPTTLPASVAAQIVSDATVDRIAAGSLWGSSTPNRLLYSLGSGSSTPPPPPPPPPPATQTIAVKSIIGSSVKAGSGWRASGTVTVHDVGTGAVLSGVTVSGSFSLGGSVSCVTSSSGSCTLTSALIKRSKGTVTTLSITKLSGTNMTYDATRNLQSQLTITAP